MKIAIDIRSAGGEKAGKGWYTFNLVRHLLAIDKSNQYVLYTKSHFPGFEEFKNVEIKLIKTPGVFWHFQVLRDLYKQQADVFFAPSSYIIPAFISKKVRTIFTVHDLVAFIFSKTHNKKATFIEKLLLKRALSRSQHVLTVSENTKKDLLTKFHADHHKISVIYCAADPIYLPVAKDKLQTFIKKTQLPEKFFLAVGTIEPRKNYLTLIEAFAKFNEKNPTHHLLIVGGKGWDYQKIYDLVRSHHLSRKVHFLGYLSNTSIRNLYNLAEALVFPSIYEGFGMPVLEAMHCKCPVIASDNSSLPEVAGKAALFLADPQDKNELAAALSKISSDPKFRDEIREKSLIQAQKFSWKKSAEQLKALLTK